MEMILGLVQIGVGLCTMALMAYTLWRMVALTAESRAARVVAVAASRRAEDAAMLAASHAADTAVVIAGVGADIKELSLNTNSIKDALIETTKDKYYALGVKDEKDNPGANQSPDTRTKSDVDS